MGNKIADLLNQIEKLKQDLNKLLEMQDLASDEVVKMSQKLDKLIVDYQMLISKKK